MKLQPLNRDEMMHCKVDDDRRRAERTTHCHPFPITEIYAENRDPAIKVYPREKGGGKNGLLSHLRVSFEVDQDNQIRVLEIDAASPSKRNRCDFEEDSSKIWWSRKELIKIWKREQSVCDFYRHSEDDYIDQVRRIYCRCATRKEDEVAVVVVPPPTEEEEQEGRRQEQRPARRSQYLKRRQNSNSELEDDIQLLVVRSSNRGLENRLVQMKELHRRKFVEGVLDQQIKVSQNLQNPQKRQQMIRKRSMFLSRTAKVFAQLMGTADAIIAQKAIFAEDKVRDLITLEQLSDSFVLSNSSSFSSTSTSNSNEQQLEYSSSSGLQLWDSLGSLKWGESFRFHEEQGGRVQGQTMIMAE